MKRIPILIAAAILAFGCAVLPMGFASASAAQDSAQNQGQVANPDDPKFTAFVYDVVSIKPYKQDPYATSSWMGSQDSPDGFTMHNAQLTLLIGQAYRTQHSKIVGAPAWVNNERYDVEAKMDPEVADAFQKLSPADQKLARQHMLRVLVRDYLKFSFHMETAEVPIYELVIGKNGSKLKAPADPSAPDGGMRCSSGGGGLICEGKSAGILNIVNQLSVGVGRPVFDKTGLTGKYDFTLKFTPERRGAAGPGADISAPPDEAPTIAIAVEEQLGLKLVSAKGPMDSIVIDHIERPGGN